MLAYNLKKISGYALLFLLAACSESTPPFKGVKIGKPYEINGTVYTPAADSTYDKIGDASWYGPGFHGKRTASGEVFDQNDVTAAHPTLPIPSLVKVTNLSNNKSVVVRVNDRGPFHSNRIIDLSKRSAEMIDLRSTKPVRVQFLKQETEDYLSSIIGKSPRIDMVAYNENYNNKASGQDNSQPQTEIASTATDYSNNKTQNDTTSQAITSSDLEPAKQPAYSHFVIKDAEADEISPQPSKPMINNTKQDHVLRVPPPKQQAMTESKPVKTTQSIGTASSTQYSIIAGSFSSQANANNLAGALNTVNNHKKLVTVEKVERNGREWWRVMVGPFTDRDAAEKALQSVNDAGVHDAHITRQ